MAGSTNCVYCVRVGIRVDRNSVAIISIEHLGLFISEAIFYFCPILIRKLFVITTFAKVPFLSEYQNLFIDLFIIQLTLSMTQSVTELKSTAFLLILPHFTYAQEIQARLPPLQVHVPV